MMKSRSRAPLTKWNSITKVQQRFLWKIRNSGLSSDSRSLCGDQPWMDWISESPSCLWMPWNQILPVPVAVTCLEPLPVVLEPKTIMWNPSGSPKERLTMSNNLLLMYKFWRIDSDGLRQYVKKILQFILYTARQKCSYQLGSLHAVCLPTLSILFWNLEFLRALKSWMDSIPKHCHVQRKGNQYSPCLLISIIKYFHSLQFDESKTINSTTIWNYLERLM